MTVGGHIAGVPIEEALASLGPALALLTVAGLAVLRGRLREVRRARKVVTTRRTRTERGAR